MVMKAIIGTTSEAKSAILAVSRSPADLVLLDPVVVAETLPHRDPFWLVGRKIAGKPLLMDAVKAPWLSVVYAVHDITSVSSVALVKPVLVIDIDEVAAFEPRLVTILMTGSFRITRLWSS